MAPVYRITGPVVLNPLFLPGPLPINTDFFTPGLTIKKDALKPGGGGILRVWFNVNTTGGQDTAILVSKQNPTGTTPLENENGFVNADNGFKIKSGGIYWFDVPILEECIINLQSANSPDGLVTGRTIIQLNLIDLQKIIAGA